MVVWDIALTMDGSGMFVSRPGRFSVTWGYMLVSGVVVVLYEHQGLQKEMIYVGNEMV